MTDAPQPARQSFRWWMVILGIGLVAIVVLILSLNDVQSALAWLEGQGRKPWAPIVAIGLFVIGSYVLVPQWVLIGAAMTTFGFFGGIWVSWIGSMLAVIVHLGLARPLGGRIRARYTGSGLRRLMAMFRDNSLKSGFIVRLIPSGPALLVNSAAGLAGVKPIRFLIGTGVGIIPKILLTGFVAQGAISLADGERIALWITLGAAFAVVQFLLIRYLKRTRNVTESEK